MHWSLPVLGPRRWMPVRGTMEPWMEMAAWEAEGTDGEILELRLWEINLRKTDSAEKNTIPGYI